MQNTQQFFSSGGSSVPLPKRVVPANRGNYNALHLSNATAYQRTYLSRVAAGTMYYCETQGVGNSHSLLNCSTGSTIASFGTVAAATAASMTTGTATWIPNSLVYDATGGFWYILLTDGTKIALFKINDTTGAMTLVGTAFTPTNIARWSGGYAWLSGTTLNYISLGTLTPYLNTINVSTGALLTQDQNFVLSDGTNLSTTTLQNVNCIQYVTTDLSTVVSFTVSGGGYPMVGFNFAKAGTVALNSPGSSISAALYPQDGLCFGGRPVFNGESLGFMGGVGGWRHFDRADFDRYVKALVKSVVGL